ncbi:MAG: choice-of-anchor B family protein, partial [Flavobacteriales bacterium]|nr:choice-of-anchor B family protein [Flavobacteriales bacterium]
MKKTLLFLFVAFSANGFAQGHMNLDSLFNWQDTSLPPSGAHNNTYNEIWGYAKNGAEYAIIGSTMGTHIFDVTVPSASSQVAFIEGAFTGPGIVHRDFHDHDDYLYMVSDEGSSTLQIADLRFLPDSAPLVYDSPELFPRSHNIFIDTTSARMYVCGGTVDFAVYSLADPTAPTLLLDCPEDVPFWSAIGYVHDVYVKGDTAYLNAGANGLFVVDFSNIGNPQMIGSLDTYVQSGYNHSGWLMKDQPYYALADETHGMDVKIIDVSDMSDLFVTDTIGSDVSPVSIPHNLIYRDNYLFVSYYFDGVYMFDCSNPAHPVLAGFYDTSTEIATSGVYRGCWGVYP